MFKYEAIHSLLYLPGILVQTERTDCVTCKRRYSGSEVQPLTFTFSISTISHNNTFNIRTPYIARHSHREKDSFTLLYGISNTTPFFRNLQKTFVYTITKIDRPAAITSPLID